MLVALGIDLALDTHAIGPGLYAPTLYVMVAAFAWAYLIVVVVGVLLNKKKPKNQSLYRSIAVELRRRLDWKRLVRFAAVLILFPPFVNTFTGMKTLIPKLNAFSWDEGFMRADRALHFGAHPWEILHPLFVPGLTVAFSFAYHAWYFVLLAAVIWQAFRRERVVRMQFLVSFLLLWVIGGTVLATVFSSGGPCFYERITGDAAPFGELMSYLGGVTPMAAITLQDKLWHAYQTGQVDVASGISAMPSIHVATCVLLALLGWKTSRPLGVTLTSYALITIIGSVHLGYHYAIDGYVGAALAIGIWVGVGAIMKKTQWLQPHSS